MGVTNVSSRRWLKITFVVAATVLVGVVIRQLVLLSPPDYRSFIHRDTNYYLSSLMVVIQYYRSIL
jgi:hypothetical protein